ncbi:uncharacterized protein F4822DRAFT_20192 [Hypoxylon trugodes]|uniref:uncharacterized protein n=1 Tax=Hypoxylon trugodes TaxID=326681 RepID=UPI0021956894|nr:uncharacterized protein F4822DRAFT_20192 [Hypoxylon trugodes]KAI1393656.1 hypothetical protein F4822DRAFT_20192 [Hypoxylon trugodes]
MDTLEAWTKPYLLIFDNVEFSGILDYVPRAGPAAIVITSRILQHDSNVLDTQVLLRDLPLDTAIPLLLHLLGFNDPRDHRYKNSISEAKNVVQRLGALPLTIHAVASYMKAQHLTGHMSQFLQQYEQKKLYMLRKSSHSWGYARKNQDVFTTWELSLQALRSDELSRERMSHFLAVCSFLSPRRISCVLFEQHYRRRVLEKCICCPLHNYWMRMFLDAKGKFDRSRFREVVVELEAISLVESCSVDSFGFVSFSLHPLVRDWAMVRPGCCHGQIHFAEALACLAATYDTSGSLDSIL